MQDIYIYFIGILFLLAIIDLVVGVSNDAVNFLNSSIGSQVTSRRNILIIASLGIFLGAALSSGMMEVARKGIFNPALFSFSDIMIVFLAVMLTDILLLDGFNTYGLPTSTTVSIVFELLGAAVSIALIKVSFDPSQVASYINSGSALAIISGIFLSVGIAFLFGMIVQFISRVVFSYNYDNNLGVKGVIWSSIALTAMLYFILIKGSAHNIFISLEVRGWIQDNVLILSISGLVISHILMTVLWLMKVNLLKVVVLLGTFSLALSFASNDLVNFVGVPLAGFSSFQVWASNSAAPGEFMMTSLTEPVITNSHFLLIAGIIMIITLWFSKKARKVTETEVNLASSNTEVERFRANPLSHGIVTTGMKSYSLLKKVTPPAISQVIRRRYTRKDTPHHNRPAFDLVRAAVNLTAASLLISLATSMKLPLSTTYVSFMVAMGTALGDRAWGRKSAAQRISGVLTVLGGWFLTAFIAFTVSGGVAFMIYYLEVFGLIVVILLILASLFISHRVFTKREQKAMLEPMPS